MLLLVWTGARIATTGLMLLLLLAAGSVGFHVGVAWRFQWVQVGGHPRRLTAVHARPAGITQRHIDQGARVGVKGGGGGVNTPEQHTSRTHGTNVSNSVLAPTRDRPHIPLAGAGPGCSQLQLITTYGEVGGMSWKFKLGLVP